MPVSADTMKNMDLLKRFLETTRKDQPDLVLLPEMFCCPYQTKCFPIYAEEEGGEVWQKLSEYAKTYGIYLVAGSVPERDGEGRIYNTSYVFDREGKQIAKHRKVHLFDINVKNGQCFKGSDTLTPGNQITVFGTEYGKMGVCICYDIRFPEMLRLMAENGVKLVLVPAAFNMTTGPAHWEITFRTRALDNQIYMLGCAPARDPESGYTSWGHTILTNPWGAVEKQLDEKEGILMAQIDFDYEAAVREQLPLLKHRRRDLYRLECL